MVSQLSKNGNSVNTFSPVLIQVNRLIKTPKATVAKEKDGYAKNVCDSLTAANNSIDKWENVLIKNVSELVDIISKGYAFRFGIKKDGNEKEHVKAVWGLALDFDKNWTEGDTCNDEFIKKYAVLWYRTPSYKMGNNKHRAVFLFDKAPNNLEDFTTIYEYFLTRYPADKSCKDIGRFFYGSRGNDGWIFQFDESNRLNVDEILHEAHLYNEQQQVSLTQSNCVKNGDDLDLSLTEKFLQHLNQHLFLGVYKGDLGALYSLHNASQRWKTRRIEKSDEIARLQGSNPFSSTNSTGSSFLIIAKDGKMPFFWDKSCSIGRKMNRNNGREMNHGSYLDYYFHVRQRNHGDFIGIEYDKDTGLFPKGFFFTLCNHICETFKIPKYDFGDTSNIFGCFKSVLESYKDQLYIQGWNMEGDTMYIVFDRENGVWLPISKNNLVSQYLMPTLEKMFTNAFDLLVEWCIENKVKKQPKLSTFFADYVQAKYRTKLMTFPDEKHYLIPLKNGVWNTQSYELEFNKGQVFNFLPSVPLTHAYYPVSNDNSVIANFKTFYTDWLRSDIQGEILLAYHILCVQRKAYKLRSMVVLMGESTKGKSTYASLVCDTMKGDNLKHPFARKHKATTLFGGSEHSSSAIEGSYLIYLDEMNNLPKNGNNCIEDLKLYVSEERDRVLNVNPKFEKQRDVISYAAFIGTSEDVLQIATSDGLDNRIKYIRVDNLTNMGLKDRIDNLRDNTEIIHNWCLQQDADYWQSRFIELSSHIEIKNNLIEKKRESEPLIEFLETYIETTDDSNDFVQTDQLWRLFRYWREEEEIKKDFNSKQSFGMTLSKILSQSKYGINWKGKKLQVNNTKGYTNLKLKPLALNYLHENGGVEWSK